MVVLGNFLFVRILDSYSQVIMIIIIMIVVVAVICIMLKVTDDDDDSFTFDTCMQ